MQATAAVRSGRQPVALPPPLVRLREHPLQWLRNHSQLLITAVILAWIGMHIAAGVYYLLFEVDPTMNDAWHFAVADSGLRHLFRNVGEGLLGGLLGQQAIWNHYRRLGKLTWLDRLEIRLHIANVKDSRRLSVGQLLASPFLAILYAVPGFCAGYGIAALVHHNAEAIAHVTSAIQLHVNVSANPHAASIWAKMEDVWVQNWDQKLIGYGSAFFFGRQPVRGVFDDLQLWLAERRVALGKPVHFYHTPTFRARYNDVRAHGVVAMELQAWQYKALAVGIFTLGFGLAVWGWYVLTYIA